MSDSKKPTVSEIRARAGNPFPSNTGQMLLSDIPHLLALVERLREMVDNLNFRNHSDHHGPFEDCDYPKCRRVRALLEELKQ